MFALDDQPFNSGMSLRPEEPQILTSVDAEEAVIGGILIDENALDRVVSILKPYHFSAGNLKTIYEVCLDLLEANIRIDIGSVTQRLRDLEQLDQVGGFAGITRILNRTVSAVNIDYQAQIIVERCGRRNLVQAGQEIVEAAQFTAAPLAEILDRSQSRLVDIAGLMQSRESQVPENLDEISTREFAYLESGAPPDVIRTGLIDYDNILGGWVRANLHMVLGLTGMGKTQFLIYCASIVAASYRQPVIIFSCEMSKREIFNRLLSRVTGIPSRRLRDRLIGDEEWDAIAQATDFLSGLPIVIHDNPDPSHAEVQAVLRQTLRKEEQRLRQVALAMGTEPPQARLGLVLFDYLQILSGEGWGNHENRVQTLRGITRRMFATAKDFDVPFVTLAQVAPDVRKRSNARPGLDDIADAKGTANDCYSVTALHREEVVNPEAANLRNIAELIVLKNREGETGTAQVLFQPDRCNFLNAARNAYQ